MTVKLDSETLRQLVFRDKSDGNYERVAFYSLGAVGYGLIIFIDLADLNGLEAVSAENSRDRMAQVQGDVIIGKALVDISRKSGGRGVYFIHAEHLRALKSQTASHDEPDIARAEDNAFLGRHNTEAVREMLCRAGGEHSCGARAVDEHLLCASLAAAGCKHEAFARDRAQSLA